jgi:DNA-3-methyladenine glycosylase
MGVLAPDFFARPTLEVLAELPGKVLVHSTRGCRAAGVIVEAEAYIGESDPACHAAPGPTRRNAPLYGPPGRAYVYLNYGLHALVNAVTEAEGRPAAILLRALEPVDGLDTMRRRRARVRGTRRGLDTASLCRGPGNLTVAMGVTLVHNRIDLTCGPLVIEDWGATPQALVWTPRIGIRVGVERPWRVAVAGHPCVSGPRVVRAPIAGARTAPRRSAPRS